MIYANNPEEIDYTKYGINDALIIDNTGKWRDEAGLSLHLKAKGASKVMLTAPGKGDLKNIVLGINDFEMSPGYERVIQDGGLLPAKTLRGDER